VKFSRKTTKSLKHGGQAIDAVLIGLWGVVMLGCSPDVAIATRHSLLRRLPIFLPLRSIKLTLFFLVLGLG
jgi:hypothetical protein